MTSTTATSTMRPPRSEVGLIGWLRKNLFSSVTNTLLTIIGLWIIWKVIAAAIGWAILSATFEGSDGAACSREHAGACWPFIQAKFSQFMYGRYPEPQRWRVDLRFRHTFGSRPTYPSIELSAGYGRIGFAIDRGAAPAGVVSNVSMVPLRRSSAKSRSVSSGQTNKSGT